MTQLSRFTHELLTRLRTGKKCEHCDGCSNKSFSHSRRRTRGNGHLRMMIGTGNVSPTTPVSNVVGPCLVFKRAATENFHQLTHRIDINSISEAVPSVPRSVSTCCLLQETSLDRGHPSTLNPSWIFFILAGSMATLRDLPGEFLAITFSTKFRLSMRSNRLSASGLLQSEGASKSAGTETGYIRIS